MGPSRARSLSHEPAADARGDDGTDVLTRCGGLLTLPLRVLWSRYAPRVPVIDIIPDFRYSGLATCLFATLRECDGRVA